jgi:hypothetical protein
MVARQLQVTLLGILQCNDSYNERSHAGVAFYDEFHMPRVVFDDLQQMFSGVKDGNVKHAAEPPRCRRRCPRGTQALSRRRLPSLSSLYGVCCCALYACLAGWCGLHGAIVRVRAGWFACCYVLRSSKTRQVGVPVLYLK